jgi:hypothetical protein
LASLKSRRFVRRPSFYQTVVYDVQVIFSDFLAAIVRTAAAVRLKIEQTEIRETSARTRGLITNVACRRAKLSFPFLHLFI